MSGILVRTNVIALLLLACSTAVVAQEERIMFMGKPAPLGFIPPPVDPTGVILTTKELAPGVYALMADRGAVNNNGFVIGKRGVLVVDPQINNRMAQQTLNAIRVITDKPILYLTNANYHSDHTFGSYVYPASTQVIVHTMTARVLETMNLEQRKHELLLSVSGLDVFDGVVARTPDIVFDNFLSIDLGGITVEIHHFGAGNTPGDIVVYVPRAKAAWTGNLIAGIIPPIFIGNSREYLATLKNMKNTLDIDVFIPGHGRQAAGVLLDDSISYVGKLVADLDSSLANGSTLDQVYDELPLERYRTLPPGMPPPIQKFVAGLHRLNLQRTYDHFREQR